VKADYLGVNANAEDWARRLIPFDRDRLRREIKETARQVLGGSLSSMSSASSLQPTWLARVSQKALLIPCKAGRRPGV